MQCSTRLDLRREGLRKTRTAKRRSNCRPRCSLERCRSRPIHRAVMNAMSAAACRQPRIAAGLKRCRHGTQREKHDQQDGESAPHVETIVHERCVTLVNGMKTRASRVSSVHPAIFAFSRKESCPTQTIPQPGLQPRVSFRTSRALAARCASLFSVSEPWAVRWRAS